MLSTETLCSLLKERELQQICNKLEIINFIINKTTLTDSRIHTGEGLKSAINIT